LVVALLATPLFVPLCVVAVGTLHAPVPWNVYGAVSLAGVLVASAMGWVAFPFAVGAWTRRRWWPPVCLGVVLATGWVWNGGHAVFAGVFGPNPEEPIVVIWVVPLAVAYGGIAAAAAAFGVAGAGAIRRADPDDVRGWAEKGLVAAVAALVVTWIALANVAVADAGAPLRKVGLGVVFAASLFGAAGAGLRIGRW
jgi:hypothetical protein